MVSVEIRVKCGMVGLRRCASVGICVRCHGNIVAKFSASLQVGSNVRLSHRVMNRSMVRVKYRYGWDTFKGEINANVSVVNVRVSASVGIRFRVTRKNDCICGQC